MESAPMENLNPEQKRELLRQLMARKQATLQGPLTSHQARLFFFQNIFPNSPAYNMHQVYRIKGALQLKVLEAALNEIVARHESLRTAFQEHLDQPLQIVKPSKHFALDLRQGHTDQDAESQIRTLLRDETLRPFDLAAGYLFRFPVLRLSPNEHVLIIVMHHLVADIWSFKLLNNELTALYRAFRAQATSPLAPLPMQFREYAAWTRQRPDDAEGLAYWRKHLAGIEVSELPTDHPRGAVPQLRGAVHRFPLDPALIPQLNALAEEARLSLPMAWMALFHLLLYRTTDHKRVSCATPIANRDRAEAHHLIGFMVNTLVLRSDFSGNPNMREVLRRFYQVSRSLYLYPEVAFDQVVREVLPVHDSSRNPLYELMFQVGVVPQLALDELEVENILAMEGGAVRSDMEFYVGDAQAQPEVLINYDSSLFEPETLVALGERFQQVLRCAVRQPDLGVDQISVLTEHERATVLGTWNSTAKVYSRERCMHELFEQQVLINPEAVAAVCGSESLTYDALNQRANRLAHELRQRGVGPERFVGVCCPRSLEMLIAVLAIQKAGAAYVPMDADFPLDRIAYILEDVNALALLTHTRLEARLAGLDFPMLCLDRDHGQDNPSNPSVSATSDNTAYLIFTSGSTGRPKGVVIRHHTVINLIEWVNQTFSVGAQERLLFTTSLCFDLSVYDIFGILAAGGCIQVALEDQLREPARLVELLETAQISFWDSAPAALLQLVPFLPSRGKGSQAFRLAFLSGDWIPLSLPPALETCFPNLQVIGLGGATEATIWSNFFPIKMIDPEWKSIPYGNPIQNARYYTLDSQLQQAPINAPADLYIAGNDCLSYGYFKQPRLTAERYLPDAFSQVPGAFLYTTGDRARWCANGYMEFLGRRDAQVKIRGFRIELGEIEACLLAHERVKEVVALAREDVPGDKRLVVYVQTHDGHELSFAELAAFLKLSLPDYMIPSARVMVEQWPVTVNGKLDRKALKAPGEHSDEALYVAPQGETETVLCQLFAELLELERVGATDSFFNIGGHSLTAAQAVARMRKLFELELPIRELFNYPSAAELAPIIDRRLGRETTSASMLELQTQACTDLAFAQERLWYFGYLAPGSCVYNLTTSIRLRGSFPAEHLAEALRLLVLRHEPLRTRFPMAEGRPQAVVEAIEAFAVPFEHHPDLDVRSRDALAQVIAQDNQDQPFDLERELPFRVRLVSFAPDDLLFVCAIHHIVCDGWSVGLLFRELNQNIAALLRGEHPLPAPLPLRYSDYVAWQRSPARMEETDRVNQWWIQQLAGNAPVLQLPVDRPRPPEFGFHGRDHFFKLSAAEFGAVQRRCGEQGVTSFMFLLAALKLMLWRYSGQNDIWIGTSAANRGRVELETLIGLFFNTLVLRTQLGRDLSVAELLQRVRQTTLDAYEHEDLSFERLVEALNPERDLSHNPLFQVMFTHMAEEIPLLEVVGVAASRVASENHNAKFDLIFDLAEQTQGGVRVRVEYNTDLFDLASIQRMEMHYRAAINAMIEQPQGRVAELNLLRAEERHQLLYDWNDTEAPFQEHATLHSLFERMAAAQPEALALVQGQHQLSYGELDRDASKLATALRLRGVGPGQFVPFCFERGPQMIIAMLAILKSGAAYVPTDVRYPLERVRYIVEELDAKVFLTHQPLASKFSELDAPILLVEEALEAPNAAVELPSVDAEDLAYIIFTSGSTGKPKGVMLQHRPVVNLIEWVNQTFSVGKADRLLFTTSPCFDLSVYDIFGSLAAGASVQIANESEVGDALALVALLRDQPITFWDSAPAALLQLVPLFPTQGNPSLRLVFLSGDWIPLSLPAAVMTSFPNARVIGLGGATEAAIWSNFFPITVLKKEWRSIPYGRPIQNAAYHILDANLQPCPINVAGDLYIGARCLSYGYYRQPGLTAQRYVPDPFSTTPGRVLYHTGDRARFYADGNIEFLGRRDAQVKIRGFRIELGEIEAVLAEHPGVREAIVLAREDRPGDKQLVAYLLPLGEPPSASACSDHLRQSLPDYMVPSVYMCLETWPVTANGKLDRNALPAPDRDQDALVYLAPRTAEEALLAGVFAEVLERDQVGVRDNYFELGGDSIQSIRIIAKVREAGLNLSPRHFFQGQTIEGILSCVRAQDPGPATGADLHSDALSVAQQGLFYFQQIRPNSSAYHVDLGIHLATAPDLDLLARAATLVVSKHHILHSSCHLLEGVPRWNKNPVLAVEIPCHDASAWSESDKRAHMLQQVTRPFDLNRGQFLRIHAWKLADGAFELIFTLHHLITDALSLRLLLKELAQTYDGLVEGQTASSAEPPQYSAYVAWQAQWLHSDEAESIRNYWRETLRDSPAQTALPFDMEEPPQAETGAVLVRDMAPEARRSLETLCDGLGVTRYAVLLSVFSVLVHQQSQAEDMVIGTDVSTRGQANTQAMQGLFINQLPLRLRFAGSNSFRELTARAVQTLREALAHQDLPFDQILEASGQKRQRGQVPLFQCKLGYHQMIDLPDGFGQPCQLFEVPRHSTQIELNLNFMETSSSLLFHLQYDSERYHAARMERLVQQFETLLQWVASDPDTQIDALSSKLAQQQAEELAQKRQQKFGRLGMTRRQETSGT